MFFEMFDADLFWRQFTSFGDRAENDEVDGSKDYLSVIFPLSKFLMLAGQTFNGFIRRRNKVNVFRHSCSRTDSYKSKNK